MILIANYAEHQPEIIIPRSQLNSPFKFNLSLFVLFDRLQEIAASIMSLSVSRRQGDGLVGSFALIRNSGQPAREIMHLVLPLTVCVFADGARQSNPTGTADSDRQRGHSQNGYDYAPQ
jgi:hypothetical protein